MALITEVKIDQTVMKTSVTNRTLTITSGDDAMYSVYISRTSNTNVYNFTTKAFAVESTQSFFKGKGSNNIDIAFPAAASGDTYEIKIFATKDTEFNFGKNKLYHSLLITQVGNAMITFQASGTGVTDTDVGTSTGSSSDVFASEARPTVVMDSLQLTLPPSLVQYGFFITNTSTDSNNGTWDSGALYWQTTETADGAVASDSNQLVVDDTSNLVVGMELTYITGTTAPGSATTITAVNLDTKTLTLSRDQAITDGHTMTFRAYGSRLIKNAIGIGVDLIDPTVKLGQTTTTFTTAITSDIAAGADINVNGTAGIGKGATIRMRGIDKSAAGTCTVATVTGHLTAGSLTIANGKISASAARPVRAKTKIYIDGSSALIYLNGTLSISKYPLVGQTISIDTNKILTAGTAS